MRKTLLREWKKVFETDLSYISFELKDTIAKPALLLLEGPMGAGKTTFAKHFIDDPNAASPTYSIITESRNILHADFYRLETKDEVLHLELPLYLESKQFFLAEWGEKFISTIVKDLPEGFNIYLLEISVNDVVHSESNEKALFSRNFMLYELSEL
jgi:tRNA threonylcarbamoyladenosine biosynthesis protein TsaE